MLQSPKLFFTSVAVGGAAVKSLFWPTRLVLTSNLSLADCEIAGRAKWQLPGSVSYCTVRRSQLWKFGLDWSAPLIEAQAVGVFVFSQSASLGSFCYHTLRATLCNAAWSSGGSIDTSAQTLTRSLRGWPINLIFFFFPGANLQFCVCPRVVKHEDQEGGWKSKIES